MELLDLNISHIHTMRKYFRRTGENIFCTTSELEEAASMHAPQFLKHLLEQVDFEALCHERLLQYYKGQGTLGAAAYRPTLLFKMLFLSYLFNQSEREIERTINDSISMKQFLGLGISEAAPDHSSLTKFKNRVLRTTEDDTESGFLIFFDEIVLLAQQRGVDLGYTQAIDSTHVIADVNTRKEAGEKKQAKKEERSPKAPRDPDAVWGVKRVKTVQTTEKQKVKINESYYGFKAHFSTSCDTNLITSLTVTPMSASDNLQFMPLLQADTKKGIPQKEKTAYTSDRAYDDGELHAELNQRALKDGIALKKWTKKEKTVEGPLPAKYTVYTSQEEHTAALKKRFVVERVNASVKKDHSLDRARYLGMKKFHLQVIFSSLAHNLKTLVKLWTGVGLRVTSSPNLHVSVG